MGFGNLSAEQMDRLKAASSFEEMEEVVAEEGFTLSDEQLDAIAGGGGYSCPDHGGCSRKRIEPGPGIA